MIAREKDQAEFTKTLLGLAPYLATGGGAGDDVFQVGPAIDRLGFLNFLAILVAQCVIASSQTVLLTLQLTDCATIDGTYADFGSPTTLTIVDGADETGKLELALDLSGAKRYLKVNAKANPTATGTATFGVSVALGGADVLPAA